jgi:hypothetical protein
MGGRMSGAFRMSGVLWWLAERSSRVLIASERDAVIGDIAESGATGARALRDVFDLIVRRNWRIWLTLAALAGQAFVLQVFLMKPFRDFDIWWKYGVRSEDGLSAGEDLFALTCHCAALICYVWTSSFALGFFCRRKIHIKAALLYLVWLCVATAQTARLRMPFPGAAFLVTLDALLIVVPSLSGMRQAVSEGAFGLSQIALLTSATVTTASLVIWTSTWSVIAIEVWSEGQIRGNISWLMQVLLPFVILNWPAAYLAVNARRRSGVNLRRLPDPH